MIVARYGNICSTSCGNRRTQQADLLLELLHEAEEQRHPEA